MRLNGKEYTRSTLYGLVGIETQTFGIRAMEYRQGDQSLIKTYEVDTGEGLSFSVGENKGMDIYRMSYRGVNLGFMSKAGLHSPYNVEPESEGFRYSQGCGLLYTAGITNVGGPCRDIQGTYITHGAVKNSAACNVSAYGEWHDDEYRMEISGELREAAFYGRNLVMKRTISAQAGSRFFTIEDAIENRAFEDDAVMLLYHINAGFPLLEEGVRMIAPVREIKAVTPRSAEMLGEYAYASAPIPMEEEYVYTIKLGRNVQGMSGSVLWNDRLKLGLCLRFDARSLDRFVEWKCMRAGDYSFGMLPANCYPFGRNQAAEEGVWTRLKPFETMRTYMEIGVLDGEAELKTFEEWIQGMKQ